MKNYRKLAIVSLMFIFLLIMYLFLPQITVGPESKIMISGTSVTFSVALGVVLWLLASYIITIVVNLFIWDGIIQQNSGPVPGLLKSATNVVFFLLAIIGITSQVLQKSISTLLATTGALSLLIGFAMRHVLENAVQSVAINLQRIFKPGDIISIPGKFDELAEVKDINMSNTYLEDFVGNIIAIPNNVVSANLIRNYSHPHENIFSIYLKITISAQGLSVKETMLILSAVMESTDFIITYPKYHILIAKVDSTQVKYNISCWAARNKVNPLQAKHLLYLKIIEQLASAGFDIGTPPVSSDNLDLDKKAEYKPNNNDILPVNNLLTDKKSVTVLKRSTLFSLLSNEELVELNMKKTLLHFKAGENIFQQQASDNMVYILVEGVLQTYITPKQQNNLLPLNKLVPGYYYGETCLWQKHNISQNTIIAITDAIAYGFSKDTVLDVLKNHPDIMEKIKNKHKELSILTKQKEQQYYSKLSDSSNNQLNKILNKFKTIINTWKQKT